MFDGNSHSIVVDYIDRLIVGLGPYQRRNSTVAQAIQELRWLKADAIAGLLPLSDEWELWFFHHAQCVDFKLLSARQAIGIAEELTPLLLHPNAVPSATKITPLPERDTFAESSNAPTHRNTK